MFRFLKVQYQLGKIAAEKLRSYCPRIITPAQYEEITGEPLEAATATEETAAKK